MSLSKIKIGELFPKISETCRGCKTCCRTYGWLLKKEAKQFIKKGYPVIQLNNSIFCIDSFNRNSKGQIILDKIPRCRFYKKRKCLIQEDKPLDCKLFPIKVKFYRDSCIFGLSLGCKYISNLNGKKKEELYQRVIRFIKEMPNEELNDYINLMKKIHLLSNHKRFWMKKLIECKKQKNSWRIVNFFS